MKALSSKQSPYNQTSNFSGQNQNEVWTLKTSIYALSLSSWHRHVPVPTKAGWEPWVWQTLMHAGRRHLKGAHLYLSHQQIKRKPMLIQSFQQLHHHYDFDQK